MWLLTSSRRYFALSKTHHPDHNPNDPTAARRFVRVSEAYVVLGSTEKRQRYDREQLRSPQSGPQSRPAGSHSSTSGPAGGRSPSGLSRRRTHFKGPPPSFYRSGQWGAQREKRQRAAAAGADTPGRTTREAASDEAAMDDNDVPHFDRAGHFRTQEEQDRRRQRRLAEEVAPSAPGIGSLANFLFVGGIITLAIALPSLFSAGISRRAKHDDERVSK